MSWQNHDLKARAQVCREISAQFQTDFVDLYGAFGDAPDESLYLPDGLHPNFAGHQHILLTIAKALN
jgi:lysophospholipase L1-like esterase